jgi:septal ring factor EnvC (AmiA/AmiB activator)
MRTARAWASLTVMVLVLTAGVFVSQTDARVSSKCQAIQRQLDNQYKRIQNLQDQLARAKSDRQRRMLEAQVKGAQDRLDNLNKKRGDAGC